MDVRDLCDHDVCMCGEEFVDIYGRTLCMVPHPGFWDDWFRTREPNVMDEVPRV